MEPEAMTDPVEVSRIAERLSAAQRRAVMHRELASESCMSWRTARVLHQLGLMPRVTLYQRLTPLGRQVRAYLESRNV